MTNVLDRLRRFNEVEKMILQCPTCLVEKRCRVLRMEKIEHHDQNGTDIETRIKAKVGKHHIGKRYCKGSGRVFQTELWNGEENKKVNPLP